MYPMNKDQLLHKWLNYELSEEESKAFNEREDFKELRRLSNALPHFAAPDFDKSKMYSYIVEQPKSTEKNTWLKTLVRIAAVIVLAFGLFWYSLTLDTSVSTTIAEKQNLLLPDNSEVVLNSKSSIVYNKHDWNDERYLELEGEAYFQVNKGSTFRVKTTSGEITVLGTAFSIKQRKNIFEVICYEGMVAVNHKDEQQTLYQGDTYLIIDGNRIVTEKEELQQPAWLTNESVFKSIPYSEVLKEFERQYDVTLKLDTEIPAKTLFTGRFTHDNLDTALKSITLPLHLSFSKLDKSIILKRDN